MKKIFNKIIIILVLLIIPLNKAAASSINISCPDKTTQNQTLECKITGTTNKYISAISGKITKTENIEIINFTKDTIWQGEGDAKSFDLYTDTNKINTFNIGILRIKIKNNITPKIETISINNIYYYDENFKEIVINNVTKNIKILSTNNNLSNLEIIDHNISPNFNKNILEYELTTTKDKITLVATPEDETSTITGTGTKELDYGTNRFIITVTSESGQAKDYALIVNKPQKEQPKEPPKEQPEEPQKEPPEQKDNNSKLKSLTINNYNIEFNSNIYTYNIEIEESVKDLEIKTQSISPKAKISIKGNKELNVGKNEIIITVTAENNSQTIYKIYAIKKSNKCIIEKINILNYNLEFQCDKYDYELEIDLEDNLNIEVIPTDKNTKINIHNNFNLKHEDIIKIVVNLNDNNYTYNIKILKKGFELKELFNNKQLIIIGTIIAFTSIYLLVRLIIKRKQNM